MSILCIKNVKIKKNNIILCTRVVCVCVCVCVYTDVHTHVYKGVFTCVILSLEGSLTEL